MVAEFYSAAGVPSVGSSSQGGNWEELNRKYMLKSHSRHSRKLRLRWNTETHTAGGGGVTAIRGGRWGGCISTRGPGPRALAARTVPLLSH